MSEPTSSSPVDSGSTTLPEGPLEVGVSRVRMPVPVGIGTAGFGPFGVPASKTPFSEIYPGTTGIHGHPDFRAIALSRGEGHTVIFLRTDTVGVFQQLRRDVVDVVEARTGRSDIDDALIIGATHTHSGPGRVIDAGGPFELIADRFLPEFYERLVGAMADAVVAALDDLAPGRVGVAWADGSGGINDRRCQDSLIDYVNGDIPLLAVEQEGELVGLMMAYAIHGTVHDIEELNLSRDVAGGIEEAVADSFDHPVVVQMFNSWGADMSPGDPVVATQQGPALPSGMERIARVGVSTAQAVQAAWPELEWTDTPTLASRTLRTRIDREAIGYASDEFPYDYGAVYCNGDDFSDCDPATEVEGYNACLPFPSTFPAPMQTELSVGRVGDLHFVTFPGEPGTLLAEQVIADVMPMVEAGGEVMFLGYSQDYLGYSILEDDWRQGGYEASGALWGPRQGAYLADEAVEAFAEVFDGQVVDDRPPRVEGFLDGLTYTPYVPATPVNPGEVVSPAVFVDDDTLVTMTVAGSDPWLGAPLATVYADGQPVLRPNGVPFDSDSPGMQVRLEVVPPWTEAATERQFLWTFLLARQHPVVGATPTLPQDLELRVQ